MVNRGISPVDPEFEEVAVRLDAFMNRMDSARARRLVADEISFKKFCAIALNEIAQSLGYVLQNIDEFFRDMAWAARSGWAEGRQEARDRRLRP
jgi:hypothetical protein